MSMGKLTRRLNTRTVFYRSRETWLSELVIPSIQGRHASAILDLTQMSCVPFFTLHTELVGRAGNAGLTFAP